MEWLNPAIDLVKILFDLLKAIFWPAAIIVALLIFKQPLTYLLAHRQLKIGREGVEIGASTAEAQTKAAPTPAGLLPSAPRVNLAPAFVPIFQKYDTIVRRELPDYARRLGMSTEEALIHAAIDLAASLQLERASRPIFGSQLQAIQLLSARGGSASLSDLRPIYFTATLSFPALYQNFSFDAWINYLKAANLVEVSGDVVHLTPEGQAIIAYMSTRNYPLNMPG